MYRRPFACLLLLTLSVSAARSLPAQDAAPKPSQFLKSVGSALAARDYHKAISLIRAADADHDVVPQALWRVAHVRFPDVNFASQAWLRTAQVYARLKEDEKMVAALERGIPLKRGAARGDGDNWAEVVGQYLVQAEKWEKALATYTNWKPSSTCGTCLRDMESSRFNYITLCQAQLGKPAEAAQTAWQNHGDPLAMLSLIRLYSDAGQLEDLQKMLAQGEKGRNRLDEAKDIERALRLAVSRKWTDHLRQFEMIQDDRYVEYEFNVSQLVASWRLLQNAESSTAAIIGEAHEQPVSHYTKLLAAIDTVECRNVLVDLTAVTDDTQQAYVGSIIQARSKEPRELLARVEQRGTGKRRLWNPVINEVPTTQLFYAKWPAVSRGSLPKQLSIAEEVDN
jgi:hypothetical protein